MTSPLVHTVDLLHSADCLHVVWHGASGEVSRRVEVATQEQIAKQTKTLAEAERALSLSLDASSRLDDAQRQLGRTLYHLLDGPDEHSLQRRLESAHSGRPLNLVIRLRCSDGHSLVHHPALGWHLQLLNSPVVGPLALLHGLTLSIQLGEAENSQHVRVPGGRLQVLFMAYAPSDTPPVLNFEAEEEHFLTQMALFVQQRRLLLHVAEEGSLAELRRRLSLRSYDIIHLSGHGIMTNEGPRLLMENETGARHDVSPGQLLEVLRLASPPPLWLSSLLAAPLSKGMGCPAW